MAAPRRRVLALGAACCLWAGAARAQKAEPGAGARAADASEAQLKAAYLHKFAGFVEWPPDLFAGPGAPFLVAVAGADAVYAELARIAPGRAV